MSQKYAEMFDMQFNEFCPRINELKLYVYKVFMNHFLFLIYD